MKKKEFWLGMLTMFLLMTMVLPVAAQVGTITQELTFKNIKVTLDGKQLDLVDENGNSVEPFILNGRNYLPVRTVAEALGLNVSWDGAASTIVLTSKNQQTKPTTPSTVPSTNYSRTNPAPIVQLRKLKLPNIGGLIQQP